jgi:N12 class adenine-specific DNA methylase
VRSAADARALPVFDQLGVDHVFIDEAHYFKNLETPTKMERVAGIQTGGSQRAFDLLMKARYLDQLHPGHGVTFATGTPISNTMVELYTLQRFLDPEGLRSRGIEHFDAWAATFGEIIDTMEISPDGQTLKPRSRFAALSTCRNCK